MLCNITMHNFKIKLWVVFCHHHSEGGLFKSSSGIDTWSRKPRVTLSGEIIFLMIDVINRVVLRSTTYVVNKQ